MRTFRPVATAGVLAFAGALLLGCTVVVEEGSGPPRPPRPAPPRICTQQYEPVCAVRGERRRTFPNVCFARAEGYYPVHPGRCGPVAEPPPRPGRPQFCTREYAPVCAVRGGRARTFGNSCEARAADYRIIHPGRC